MMGAKQYACNYQMERDKNKLRTLINVGLRVYNINGFDIKNGKSNAYIYWSSLDKS